ncbi:MAG: hypothetical protein R2752_06975 [Vicinamibacterales bacterium]
MKGRVAALVALGLACSAPAAAQIAPDDYFRFMPIGYPHLVRQTAASEHFELFGDRSDPAYRDVAPADGIDDRRADWFRRLSVRFAPFMVRNTPLYPVDFRSFYSRPGFAIHVDTWDLARHGISQISRTEIPIGALADAPCTAGASPDTPDCRLVELLKAYGGTRGIVEPEATGGAERDRYTVMYMDFPGFDEKTWKAEYWPEGGGRSQTLAGHERMFVHPFVAEAADGSGRYEFVLQYWFFYPENDGPNNHEGDWEHINVIVSPRSLVGQGLDEAQMTALVTGTTPMDGADPLVMRRVEYYLHHFVMPLEFGSPNAYAPREVWEREVASALREGRGNKWVWEKTRERAWQDDAETRLNTRSVVWIGGDAIGVQSVLEAPGLRDRDGHASYPFRGYYKQIGPGVGERVTNEFDLREYYRDPSTKPEHVEDYGAVEKIAVVPDWERIADLSLTSPEVRRDWSWMLLPMRFGFPATPSPAAGTVQNADLGNVAIVGPSFNGGWNRIGDASGYAEYTAVKVSWATPMGFLDSFFPRLGWFNAPIVYFMGKPPLDLAWRSLALPVRAIVGTRLPSFVRAEAPPSRVVSFEAGTMIMPISKDYEALFVNRDQVLEMLVRVAVAVPPGGELTDYSLRFPTVVAPVYGLTFHMGDRFSAESSLASFKTTIGVDFHNTASSRPIEVRARLDQFDYHGDSRFNLATGRFKPFVKYGGGITWYRLRNMTVDGQRLIAADSPRFRPKGTWYTLGFNELLLGGGLDVEGLHLRKVTFGFKTSYTAIFHKLGFEKEAAVELSQQLAQDLAGQVFSIWRHQFRIMGTVSF